MPFLSCGRCGLEIKVSAACLRIENCPRCQARSETAVAMALSAHPVTPAIGWGSPAPDRRSDPRGPGEPFAAHRAETVTRPRELGRELGLCMRCGRPVRTQQDFVRQDGQVAHVRCRITHPSRRPASR